MDYTVINLEENIGKTVGRRKAPKALSASPGEIENAKAWRRTFGGLPVRPGVYRFTSFEEADAWLTKHQIQSSPPASRR